MPHAAIKRKRVLMRFDEITGEELDRGPETVDDLKKPRGVSVRTGMPHPRPSQREWVREASQEGLLPKSTPPTLPGDDGTQSNMDWNDDTPPSEGTAKKGA